MAPTAPFSVTVFEFTARLCLSLGGLAAELFTASRVTPAPLIVMSDWPSLAGSIKVTLAPPPALLLPVFAPPVAVKSPLRVIVGVPSTALIEIEPAFPPLLFPPPHRFPNC